MGFKQLMTKVEQAEKALEARERRVSAEWEQLKAKWKAAWTPGRIVIAGLVSGFVVGRAEPLRTAAKSGGLMQAISMVSSLFAGGGAAAAADQAQRAATATQQAAAAVDDSEEAAVARAEATVQAVRSTADPIDF